MTTGYTAGIIDGTTKTFQDFAKQCVRAFGAAIHMKEDDMKEEYKPRTPDDYYTKALQKSKEDLERAENLTDGELVEMRKTELEKTRAHYVKTIAERKVAVKRIKEFLVKAEEFEPPTEEHVGIKEFMIEQLNTTLDFDGNFEFSEQELTKTEMELQNIDANAVRFGLIEDAKRSIEYNLKKHQENIKSCADSNKWVERFLEAIE
jgi:hypothetical protein